MSDVPIDMNALAIGARTSTSCPHVIQMAATTKRDAVSLGIASPEQTRPGTESGLLPLLTMMTRWHYSDDYPWKDGDTDHA